MTSERGHYVEGTMQFYSHSVDQSDCSNLHSYVLFPPTLSIQYIWYNHLFEYGKAIFLEEELGGDYFQIAVFIRTLGFKQKP